MACITRPLYCERSCWKLALFKHGVWSHCQQCQCCLPAAGGGMALTSSCHT